MALEHLLNVGEAFHAPEALRRTALPADFAGECARSLRDPEGFWEGWAKRFRWSAPWGQVLDWKFPDHRWFIGGKTNIVDNALDRHADGPRANHTALIALSEDGVERRLTYLELREMVSKLSTGLRALGVESGDRVLIYMPLTLEGVVSMLAVARLGAIHSVVYAGLGVGALRDRIVDAGAKVIIAGDVGIRRGKAVELQALVDEATQGLDIRHIVWFQRRASGGRALKAHEVDFGRLISEHRAETAPVQVDSEHPLFILYTSGSTGKPKGVVHVHGGYMVGVSYHLRTFFDVRDDDVYWSTSDIGWVVGHSYIVYAPLLEGVTAVLREGSLDFPDPGVTWRVVDRLGVNVLFTAPTAIRMFMKFGAELPAKAKLDSLRLVSVAGEPLNPEAWRWAFEHLVASGKRGFVTDNWWQTELGAPALGTPTSHAAKPGSVGVPLPGVDAVVMDAEGREVPKGQGGLLALRRPFPHMMRTVWGDHARYRQYWEEFPGNVYAAGDVASWDKDGYFTVLGRSDDVLNVAGHRIGSADVESALVSHPSVAEAAVIGVPDPIKGEAIQAFVTLRAQKQDSPQLRAQLVEHVRHELGPIATPSSIEVRERLPKTRSGKIMRRLLRAEALGLEKGDTSTLEE
jgi:acetyl-CoA synthetase